MKTTEKILFTLIMAMMILPALQRQLNFIRLKPLDGDYILARKPAFSKVSWFSGEFQQLYDLYTEDHIGFRPFLVRLINQVDYSLFRLTGTEGVVIGKNNYLFEYDYIRAFTGGDYIGEENIDKRLRKVKFLQNYLKRELDIDFVIVFEPGKASVYPENIPDALIENNNVLTNYDNFIGRARELDIRFIDFNRYFQLLKDTASYPLYARYATHWSAYGMAFAADSIVRFIEDIRDVELRKMFIYTYQIENKPRVEDYDIALTMNLLFPLPYLENLAYPEIHFGSPVKKHQPTVLVVGDSYYWNIFNAKVPSKIFKNEAFWYFGHLVFPETYEDTVFVHQLNLKEEVEKQEVIFLMVTERFLHKFDWSFVDDLFRLYGITSVYDKTDHYKAIIRVNSVMFDKAVAGAKHKDVTVAEMLDLEARYLFLKNDTSSFMVVYGPEHYEKIIREDMVWLEKISEGSKERDISENDFIRMNAEYMFWKNHPKAFEIHTRIGKNKEMIMHDSLLLQNIMDEAEVYYLTLHGMLQIAAERMLN